MENDNTELTARKLPGKPFMKGDDPRRNLAGRPEGSISPINEVKRIFKENPETFKEFLIEYMKNPNNARHIVEMIDGRPKGDSATLNVENLENLTIVLDRDDT